MKRRSFIKGLILAAVTAPAIARAAIEKPKLIFNESNTGIRSQLTHADIQPLTPANFAKFDVSAFEEQMYALKKNRVEQEDDVDFYCHPETAAKLEDIMDQHYARKRLIEAHELQKQVQK